MVFFFFGGNFSGGFLPSVLLFPSKSLQPKVTLVDEFWNTQEDLKFVNL